MAEIVLDEVRKTYAGGVEAVKGVSLAIADGEMIVLVGPSGCGKSTLLRMIAGLETVTSGTVSIGGRVVNRLEPADRDIAMVFQNYALYPHMSVYDNLAYGLRNRRVAKAEIEARVRKAADILEIGALLDRRPRQLSGGQRQRVAMGRAIVREPAAFLFDEPLSNLDAKLRVQMRIEIKRLQRDLATTSIFVTHDQLEAMTLADRLVVLNQGAIEQVGAPLDVYRRPASIFVAGFIGSPGMNVVDLDRAGGAAAFAGPAAVAALDADPGSLAVGFRPEDVEIGGGAAGAPSLALRLNVLGVEPIGAEALLHGHLEGGGPEIVLRAPAETALAAGASLVAAIPADRLHFFDKASGRRIEAGARPA